MKKVLVGFSAVFILVSAAVSNAADWSGNAAVEVRLFPESAQWAGQEDGGFSASFQPEFRHQWNDGKNGFTFIPFFRVDSMDEERTHADIRELSFLHVMDGWEFRAGISKVFWGVTESQHLVDIINQTDLVENIDGEDKLGQPMVRVTRVFDSGSVDLFVMPWFRERTFPGENGRLRTPMVVDTSLASYESSDEERHLDYAIRWNQSVGNVDFAISWFEGTSREPCLDCIAPVNGMLIPHYLQLQQAGLEVQYTGEAWLWKLEAVNRETSMGSYQAATGGFEYTFVGINDTALDLGVIGEYLYDSRGTDAGSSPLQNDLFVGARLTFNDVDSTELLAGGIFDLDYTTKTFRVEASRRIGQDFKVSVEGQLFVDVDPADPLSAFERDGFVQVELAHYF